MEAIIMDATTDFTYEIEKNPEPQEIGTTVIHTNFVSQVINMDSILTRSRFSCSLPTTELIEDDASPTKEELYFFLKESRIDEYSAMTLIQELFQLALSVTSSVEYCPHYALSMWLTIDVEGLSSQGSVLDDSQFEEAIRASLDDYERNIGFRPASKLGVGSSSRRRYTRKPKTSYLVSNCKTKGKTSSITNYCTICLEEFKHGRRVVTLPCGHEFDNKCIVEWFKVSHVCPLCRFELPCEDDDFSQTTT